MGTVKNFNMDKGFGFIVPDEGGAGGGGDDIFAHGNALLDGNALREGMRVCFRLDYDHARNKRKAEDITGAYTDPARPPPKGAAGGVGGGGGGGGSGGLSLGAPAPSYPLPGEPPPPPGKIAGTVRNFNLEKGFGFVAPDGGGDDYFAHGNSLLDGNALREGSRVYFRPDYDNARSKRRAEDILGAYTDPVRPAPKAMASGGATGGSALKSAPRRPPPGEPAPPPGKLMGTVKNFNMDKGFGFIIPDEGGDDLFAHALNLADGNAFREGMRLCYRRGFDEKNNKWRAEDITGGYHDPIRPPNRGAGGGPNGARPPPPAGPGSLYPPHRPPPPGYYPPAYPPPYAPPGYSPYPPPQYPPPPQPQYPPPPYPPQPAAGYPAPHAPPAHSHAEPPAAQDPAAQQYGDYSAYYAQYYAQYQQP